MVNYLPIIWLNKEDVLKKKKAKKSTEKLYKVLLFLAVSVCVVGIILSTTLVVAPNLLTSVTPNQSAEIKNGKPTYEYLKSITVRVRGERYYCTEEGEEERCIVLGGWVGTGTVIKVDEIGTYILTNNHVAGQGVTEKNLYIEVNNQLVSAEVYKHHPTLDIAVLLVRDKLKGKKAVVGFNVAHIQDPVYLVGQHLGRKDVYGEGVFAGYTEEFDIIQIPCAPGNSGSGVVNEKEN